MGKWKYVNWLIGLLIVIHMYRYFYVRYDASINLYILATIGWLMMLAVGLYIFHFKLKREKGDSFKKNDLEVITKSFSKERPKVNFNKNSRKK